MLDALLLFVDDASLGISASFGPHQRIPPLSELFSGPPLRVSAARGGILDVTRQQLRPRDRRHGLSPPFPPFWQPSPELNRHSITARLFKHFSLSPTFCTTWIVIFPLPPRLRQLNIFYMLESLVPKSSAAQGPTPFARLLIALPFGASTT
ncbi:hypothetical protein HPB50_009022 [Hyalomma asiaticum]|uniref:Uncharacterized protein n=1 Tax=Hyalomma asiaticum TaxID=266040 RepID=A0ACB7SUL8_HYAAI|nr:hypothetical protein HPB50_009022 [Hyalomma asiaticum]